MENTLNHNEEMDLLFETCEIIHKKDIFNFSYKVNKKQGAVLSLIFALKDHNIKTLLVFLKN